MLARGLLEDVPRRPGSVLSVHGVVRGDEQTADLSSLRLCRALDGLEVSHEGCAKHRFRDLRDLRLLLHEGSLAADVEGVTVVNVHLQDATWDATGNTRRAQVHALRKAFSGPCVFVGDFNVEKNDAATVKEVGDALGKANYPDRPTFSKKTLDAAFGDSVQGVETVNPQHQTFVSDHLPIRVHVRQNST